MTQCEPLAMGGCVCVGTCKEGSGGHVPSPGEMGLPWSCSVPARLELDRKGPLVSGCLGVRWQPCVVSF